jgi:uncharacterized protein
MVEVHVREDSHNRLSSFFAKGHADWADAGTDIVCAAVSTLLQAAWLGLKEHAGIFVYVSRRREHWELRWPPETRDREDVRAIVTTTAFALEHIAAQYPEHVRVLRKTTSKGDHLAQGKNLLLHER